MKWYYSRILRRMKKIKDWEIAIRKRKSNDFLDTNSDNEFVPILNTDKYWFADPILFFYQGRDWLFVEAFNKEKKRGEIGVFSIGIDGSVSDYKTILSLNCHMSYPYVFKYKNNIYMIPESGAEGKIYLYKATMFPYDWQQMGVLCEGKQFRDSTVYSVNDQFYMLTYERTDNRRFFHTYECYEYILDIDNCKASLIKSYKDDKASFRPAGQVLYKDNMIIRNSQKCNRIYGEALLFWKLRANETSWENAELIKRVFGEDLRIIGRRALLTHTYSSTDNYEAVDFRTL